MKYFLVDAEKQNVRVIECEDLDAAKQIAGLDPIGVDHGTIAEGWGIVVYEFGLCEPMQYYFATGTSHAQLFAGNGVIYQYDTEGETVDVDTATVFLIQFFKGIEEVEKAISEGRVHRPYTAINGIKISEWQNGELVTFPDKRLGE